MPLLQGTMRHQPERPGLVRPRTWALPNSCLPLQVPDWFSLLSCPPHLVLRGRSLVAIRVASQGDLLAAGSVDPPPQLGCAQGLIQGPPQERARMAPGVPAGQRPDSTQSDQWAPRPPAWVHEVLLWV